MRHSAHSSPSAIALVTVLAMLALLTVVSVGFLARVGNLRKATASEHASVSARALADTAINLVQAQIDHASTRGNSTVWASQPGAIRVFDQSGSLATIYRLYSSTAMTTSTATDLDADMPPPNWADQKALWVDLNAPTLIKDPQGAIVSRFPILDPRNPSDATQTNPVEGFSIVNAPGATAAQPAPMPVRWLYVCQDGQIVAPTTSGTGSTITIAGASASNRIIGRIAFWTDDETCKLNINTASEGTYWDTPRLDSTQDRSYANSQPFQREFQRYPGHPAMTSLAPVLYASSSTSTPMLTQDQKEAIYAIIPRIVGGGSKGGTATSGADAVTPDSDRLYASVGELIYTPERHNQSITPTPALNLEKLERSRFFLTAHSRAPEVTLFDTPRIPMWPIFDNLANGRVTAYDRLIARCSTINTLPYYLQRSNSRSPTADWTDIQRNRLILRYLQSLSTKKVPGFGASLLSKTTTGDRDQLLVEMMDYIRCTNLYDDNLSPNTYSTQAAADNAVQFTTGRSTSTSSSFNGHGMVAPLRVPENLGDTYPPEPDTTSLMGFGRFATISEAGLLFICCADGKNGTFNSPLDDNGQPASYGSTEPAVERLARMESNVPPGTSDAGRTFGYQLDQSDNLKYDYDYPAVTVKSASTIYPPNNMLDANTSLAPNERRVQLMLFFDYFSPMHGWTQYAMDGSLDVEITGQFSINGSVVPISATETVNFDNLAISGYHYWGASLGYRKGLWSSNGSRQVPACGAMPADSATISSSRRYGLVSAPITVTVPAGSNPTMNFKGPTKILVKFYSRVQAVQGRSPDRTPADLVQTIELNFPDANIPIPVLATRGTRGNSATVPPVPATSMENWWSLNDSGPFSSAPSPLPPGFSLFGRFRNINQRPFNTCGNLIQPSDTLRTLVPYHGDMRLVAGSHYVPSGVFQPSTYYYDTTRNDDMNNATRYAFNWGGSAPPQIQSYLTSSGNTNFDAYAAFYYPPSSDRLVAGADYSLYQFPKFPGFSLRTSTRISARSFQQFGDFDNGVGPAADGAYINKPDEGNNARGSGTDIPYFTKSFTQVAGGPTYFSPNRQVPSPGMFGSLPSQLRTGNQGFNSSSTTANINNTWRTLLFRPQTGHPGEVNPPDHIWADLFWMPVVEPYAISEPFSTAGKINMNYAIAPFSYINRKTGMVALLRSEKILAIPTNAAGTYKTSTISSDFRLNLDIHETLKQWDEKFADKKVFLSPSQICELHLVPANQTLQGMKTFWSDHAITGDNSRERPYTNLLGRLTTKSNTFKINYTVQALKNPPSHPQGTWNESTGVILSEYRGATAIERYINPDDSSIPDYASDVSKIDSDSLGRHYNWRIIEDSQFAP